MPTSPPVAPTASTRDRYCDIVMKGGITSGVVYPLAVCELAKTYRLKNVGGTSAGAIAAALAAAAEMGRGSAGGGFERLGRLPQWLGDGGNLFNLFQPQASTRPLFELATAWLGNGSRGSKMLGFTGRVVQHFGPAVALGVALGLVPFLIGWALTDNTGARIVLGILALVVAAVGVVVVATIWVVRSAAAVLPANAYGLCRGFDAAESAGRVGLTRWLEQELRETAGLSGDRPLVFGDLWGGNVPLAERSVVLQMMTTNLTHGQPYRLPFDTGIFFFDPDEMGLYFPPNVLQWMVQRARPDSARTSADGRKLLGLPDAADLPVVFAVRLSLSFPVLISAVPLYAVDYSRPKDQQTGPERCWFSDGGISSNFPVHFFDALLPRWPTFAINLRPFTRFWPKQPAECDNIYMARNNQAMSAWWTRFEEDERGGDLSGLSKLTGFMKSILGTMQNWRDNAQSAVPGYRDRVVHVKLDEQVEGGLNLTMAPEVIKALTDRGRCAGDVLVRRFVGPPEPGVENSWPNHRWIRYRNAMAVLETTLTGLRRAYRDTMPGDISYAQLAARNKGERPTSYSWTEHQRQSDPIAQTDGLLHLVDQWEASTLNFRDGQPLPYPELRVTPRV